MAERKPRHFHEWLPTFGSDGKYIGLVCANGCGKEYKPPTQKQTEARRKNFYKMQVLGNLARAKANVQWGRHIDPVDTRTVTMVIDTLIERARKEL